MIDFKNKVSEKLAAAAESASPGSGLDAATLAGMLEYPPDSTMGDVALPCFKLSKTLRSAPPKIAETLAAGLAGNDDLFTVSVAGGYLNIRAADAYLINSVLAEAEEKGERYGSFDFGHGKTVVLDLSLIHI